MFGGVYVFRIYVILRSMIRCDAFFSAMRNYYHYESFLIFCLFIQLMHV